MYHEKSFIFWLIFQTLKSVLHFYLFELALPAKNKFQEQYDCTGASTKESRSLQKRKVTFTVNVLSIISAGVLFVLHNTICLPYGKLISYSHIK